jgi:DNA-binding response OmpR family regulator
MITADATESSTSKMRELGASTILYKPLKIDEILCAIRQLAIVGAAV